MSGVSASTAGERAEGAEGVPKKRGQGTGVARYRGGRGSAEIKDTCNLWVVSTYICADPELSGATGAGVSGSQLIMMGSHLCLPGRRFEARAGCGCVCRKGDGGWVKTVHACAGGMLVDSLPG